MGFPVTEEAGAVKKYVPDSHMFSHGPCLFFRSLAFPFEGKGDRVSGG